MTEQTSSSIKDVLAIKNASRFALALGELVARSPRAASFGKMRPAERVAWCVTTLERELDGGGFEGFYASSAGDRAQEMVAALKMIGALEAAKIVARANALVGGPPEDQEEREAAVDALSTRKREKLVEYDELFMEYPDDLPELLRKYVSARAGDFE